jgi:hypothetical protein
MLHYLLESDNNHHQDARIPHSPPSERLCLYGRGEEPINTVE